MKRALSALIALGAAGRLLAFWLRPSIHPDEYFQYIEPAWRHLHGYGWPSWEWQVGLRSWVLPGYHGAWLALLDWLSVHDGARGVAFLQLHWALLSLLVIPAAYRAAAALAGEEAGLLAAALCALFPELLYFAPHTLTELPATIFATWGLARWIEGRSLEGRAERRAALHAGLLLSLAVCLRLPDAPLALVPVIDLSLRRRWPAFAALALAALVPVLLFGAVDWATWGRPFHSTLAFLDYNFLQGRAAEHGVSPPGEYLSLLWSRTSGVALPALLLLLAALPRSWPALAPAALLVATLSTQAHKEERFILAAWPLLLIALAAASGGPRRDRFHRIAWPAGLVVAALLLVGTAIGVGRMQGQDYTGRAGLYAGEAFAGQRPDASGVLVEGRFHLSGGFTMLSRDLPLETFQPRLLENEIFNYAVVRDGSAEQELCAGRGWHRAFAERGFSVWRRQ